MPKLKPRHNNNPFWDQYGSSIANKTYRYNKVIGVEYINAQSGESHQALIEDKEAKMIDVRPFAKIAATEDVRKILLGLTPTANKLFLWLINELMINQDIVAIDGLRAQQDLGYGHINSIYQGIAGLEEAGIIAPAIGGPWNFWINPVVFYMGDATILFKAHSIAKRLNKDNRIGDRPISVIAQVQNEEVVEQGYDPQWDIKPLPSVSFDEED